MQRPNLSFMLDHWPSSIVARSEITKFSGGVLTPATIANYDAAGNGPPNRIRIGRKVAYPVADLVGWIESRSELLE